MCQAYEAEYRSIVIGENYASLAGFRAALAGKPKADNPNSGLYNKRAWDHGWECAQDDPERLLPWAVSRELDYGPRQAAESEFRKTGKLTAAAKRVVGNYK